MNPEDWKDLGVRILVVGTSANLITIIFELITGFDNFMSEVFTPWAVLQFAVMVAGFMVFSHGMEKQEEKKEEERLEELEHRIKTLENKVFTGENKNLWRMKNREE